MSTSHERARPDEPSPPPVWRGYLAYSVGLATFLFLSTLAGVVVLALELVSEEALLGVAAGVLIAFPLICLYGAVPFLPRAPWAWTYGLVVILLGLPCGCWVVVSVPLLVHWLRPETRAWFGRG